MSEIFLLGAGFSKALKSEMPLMGELTEEITISPIGAKYKGIGNVEEILSYLSQSLPWEDQAFSYRKKADFLDLTRLVGEVVRRHEGSGLATFSEEVTKISRYFAANRSQIMTLNYDTLLERILGTELVDLYPIPLTSAASRTGAGLWASESLPSESPKLFKLHGSSNYFYSGEEEFFGETIYVQAVTGLAAMNGERDITDKVPLIVPPTFYKSHFFSNETVRNLWRMAGQQLLNSETLIVFGYSLPQSDLMMKSFLRWNGVNIKRLIVIDSSPSVVPRFRELFANNVTVVSYVGDQCLRQFVGSHIDQHGSSPEDFAVKEG